MREAQRVKAEAQYGAWAADHPEKAALVDGVWSKIKAGEIERPGCQDCGAPMHPTYDWDQLVMTGWHCRSCHPRSRS